jgi:hypothetical protein
VLSFLFLLYQLCPDVQRKTQFQHGPRTTAAREGETHQRIDFIPDGPVINVILGHLTGIPFDGEMGHLLA